MLEATQQDVIALDELGEEVVRINQLAQNKPTTEQEKNTNSNTRNWSTRFGKASRAWPSLVLPK
ncbi:MAG: hypothetical protein CBC62_03905 [Opitutia bacterium TMED102]|nr:hypothetical protein [Verrucomicrobiales bacterium]OUV41237.1 MAG: hypothetical protein CBC62_03905 [Opitutae bacterium TMED102]